MIKDLKIFKKPEKEEKLTLMPPEISDMLDDIFENEDEDKTVDMFYGLHDNEIEKTLQKYNYDYKRLMKRLTFNLNLNKLNQVLRKCLIEPDEYENPTAEIFEIIRNYLVNGRKPKLEQVVKVDNEYKNRQVFDDVLQDVFYFGDEEETIDQYYGMHDYDIKRTLLRYGYDYQRLIKRLTMYLKPEVLEKKLEECGISQEEYENPTEEVFETLRNYILKGYIKTEGRGK